jgi:hypothetical protein
MPHDFDPGFPRRFNVLLRAFPEAETYPPKDFRVEWGPIFRGASTAPPGPRHRSGSRRAQTVVGGSSSAKQASCGFLARLGIRGAT